MTKVYADVFSPRGDNYADEVILISAWLPDIEEVGKPVVPIYVYTVGPLYEDRRGVRQFSTLAVLNNEINGNKVINFENSRVLKPEQRHRVR